MRKQHEDSGTANTKEDESPVSSEEESSWTDQEELEQSEYDDDYYYYEKFSRRTRDRRNPEKIPKRRDKTDW